MDKIIVTSAENPDLDGLACSYAYAEFLQKKGLDAECVIFGKPFYEAITIAKKAKAKISEPKKLAGNEKFILTDTSIVSRLHKSIKIKDVIEIIDHRKFNNSSAFTSAKLQIEFVGAAATLIAEKFMKERVPVSPESRMLLFYAILSNTLNFKNNVTTQRDRKAASWLKSGLKLGKNYLKEFMMVKARIGSISAAIKDYMGVFNFPRKRICIAQLEVTGAKVFVNKNKEKISKIFRSLEKGNRVSDSLLTAIDIEKAENIFYSESTAVQKALEDIFKVKFKDNVAYRKGIIMRKELSPLLDEYFKKRLK